MALLTALTKKFTSPINEDDGEKHRFIGNAESELLLIISDDGLSGKIDWLYTMIDGTQQGSSGNVVIDLALDPSRKRLVSFSGVFELSDECIALLEENGYNCQVAKGGF